MIPTPHPLTEFRKPNRFHMDDDDDLFSRPPWATPHVFLHQKTSSIHNFYLSGTIRAPQYYAHWFEFIRNAGEQDVIYIRVNSEGGDALTAVQMMRVLDETAATIVVSVEGACMSAATFPFLRAKHVEISNHSLFMFHNYSAAVVGKGGEMYNQINFERAWSEGLFRDVYRDFLTEEEIVALLDGRDLWMGKEETMERLKRRNTLIAAEEAAGRGVATPPEIVTPEATPAPRKRARKTT